MLLFKKNPLNLLFGTLQLFARENPYFCCFLENLIIACLIFGLVNPTWFQIQPAENHADKLQLLRVISLIKISYWSGLSP